MELDRQNRIKERRERIQARINKNKQDSQQNLDQTLQDNTQQSIPEQKISEQLAGVRATSQQFASQIELLQRRADAESTQIFANDGAAQVRRREVLEQLKEQNAQQTSAFEMRWAALIQRKQPEDLLAGLIELKALMLSTLQQKDEVAKAFEDYLNSVDDDYLRLSNEQRAEIDEIITFARKSVKQLQEKCRSAVQECEKTFDAERERFIKEGEQKLDEIRGETGKVEAEAITRREELAKGYVDQVQETILTDYNLFTGLKRQLEAEGAALYNQLEEMRAVYILNAEKLEYNYKLLASRDIECQNLIVQQKKKIGKLQSQLHVLISRHQTTDEKVRSENYELSKDYRRLANSYCELQQKFQLFEGADNSHFRKLWTFHEQQVEERLKELLLAEQVINESVLCQAPKSEIDELGLSQQIKHLLIRLQQTAKLTTDAAAQQSTDQQLDITKSINPIASCSFGAANANRILEQLAKMLNFTASDELIRTMNPGADITQDKRTETLLITLGIRNSSELDLLLQQVTVQGQCQEVLPREDIIKALIKYAELLKKKRDQGQTTNQVMKTEHTNKQGIWSLDDATKFWKELGQIACTQKATTWNMLEQTLKRYQEVLMARVDLVDRNDELAAQNEELRSLLQQYVEGEKRDLGTAEVHYAGGQQPMQSTQKTRVRQ